MNPIPGERFGRFFACVLFYYTLFNSIFQVKRDIFPEITERAAITSRGNVFVKMEAGRIARNHGYTGTHIPPVSAASAGLRSAGRRFMLTSHENLTIIYENIKYFGGKPPR